MHGCRKCLGQYCGVDLPKQEIPLRKMMFFCVCNSCHLSITNLNRLGHDKWELSVKIMPDHILELASVSLQIAHCDSGVRVLCTDMQTLNNPNNNFCFLLTQDSLSSITASQFIP